MLPVRPLGELTKPVLSQLWRRESRPADASNARRSPDAVTRKRLLRQSQDSSLVERRNRVVLPVRVETTVL